MDCLSNSAFDWRDLSNDVLARVQALEKVAPPSPEGACFVIRREILGIVACRAKSDVMASFWALYRRSPFAKEKVDPSLSSYFSVTMVRMIYLSSLQIIL